MTGNYAKMTRNENFNKHVKDSNSLIVSSEVSKNKIRTKKGNLA